MRPLVHSPATGGRWGNMLRLRGPLGTVAAMMTLVEIDRLAQTVDESRCSPVADAVAARWGYPVGAARWRRSSASHVFALPDPSGRPQSYLRFVPATRRSGAEVAVVAQLMQSLGAPRYRARPANAVGRRRPGGDRRDRPRPRARHVRVGRARPAAGRRRAHPPPGTCVGDSACSGTRERRGVRRRSASGTHGAGAALVSRPRSSLSVSGPSSPVPPAGATPYSTPAPDRLGNARPQAC